MASEVVRDVAGSVNYMRGETSFLWVIYIYIVKCDVEVKVQVASNCLSFPNSLSHLLF
jgi:hypothetical protein